MSAGQVNCLVTGATGYIGARLVPHLLDEGHRVRALARDPNKLAGVPWRDRTEVARGDLGDVDSLIAAFDGVQVVYYLVHSMGTAKNFAVEEARAVRNVVEAARRAGVRRVVYLGGLHPDGRHLSPHLESRKAVGEALIESGIETVVLQAGVVVGSGSASFEMIRHLTDRLPGMTTPKWVHNRIQPIAVRDVLYYLVAAATVDLPSLPGPAWLEITVTPRRTDGSRYTQRAIVFPRGIPGRLYWSMLRPLYTSALRALAHDIIASAGWRSRRRTTAATRAP